MDRGVLEKYFRIRKVNLKHQLKQLGCFSWLKMMLIVVCLLFRVLIPAVARKQWVLPWKEASTVHFVLVLGFRLFGHKRPCLPCGKVLLDTSKHSRQPPLHLLVYNDLKIKVIKPVAFHQFIIRHALQCNFNVTTQHRLCISTTAFLIATFGGGKGHPLGFLAHHHWDTTERSGVQFNPHVYCTNTESMRGLMCSVVLCITVCMESSLLIFFVSVSLCYQSTFVCITTCEHMLQRLCIFFQASHTYRSRVRTVPGCVCPGCVFALINGCPLPLRMVGSV